jgi:hypothetical protein
MRLPLIPHDKANHFIYGFVIFILSSLIMSNLISLCVVIVFALGKEIRDQIVYKGFDYKDLLSTIIAPIILTILNK